MTFDLDAWQERAAIMEFDGGMSRFEAETLAAKAQGLTRREAINVWKRAKAARDIRAAGTRNAADHMPRVQPAPAQEERSLPERDIRAGRGGLDVLALRAQGRSA